MTLYEVIICYNKQYFTAHDVAADGNCYYRSVCLSPVIPITDHRALREALCSDLYNILKYPSSEECKFIIRYYTDSEESKRLSLRSYLKHRMCHDGTWGTSFEMMLTALIFDVQVISLANKPNSLWPFCSKQTAESYQYPHYKLMEKEKPVFLYCHALHEPLTPQYFDRHLNHFAFLMPCELNSSHSKKQIYYGASQIKPTAYSIVNKKISKEDHKDSKCSIKNSMVTSPNIFEIDVAHLMLTLSNYPLKIINLKMAARYTQKSCILVRHRYQTK